MRLSTAALPVLLGLATGCSCSDDEEEVTNEEWQEQVAQLEKLNYELIDKLEAASEREEGLTADVKELNAEIKDLNTALSEATAEPTTLTSDGAEKSNYCDAIERCILDVAQKKVHEDSIRAEIQTEYNANLPDRADPDRTDPNGIAPISLNNIPALEVTCANNSHAAFTNKPGYVGGNEPLVAATEGGVIIVSRELIENAQNGPGFDDLMAAIESLEVCQAGRRNGEPECQWSGGYYPSGVSGLVSRATSTVLDGYTLPYDACQNDDGKDK